MNTDFTYTGPIVKTGSAYYNKCMSCQGTFFLHEDPVVVVLVWDKNLPKQSNFICSDLFAVYDSIISEL